MMISFRVWDFPSTRTLAADAKKRKKGRTEFCVVRRRAQG
jgi:hypothetical protein